MSFLARIHAILLNFFRTYLNKLKFHFLHQRTFFNWLHFSCKNLKKREKSFVNAISKWESNHAFQRNNKIEGYKLKEEEEYYKSHGKLGFTCNTKGWICIDLMPGGTNMHLAGINLDSYIVSTNFVVVNVKESIVCIIKVDFNVPCETKSLYFTFFCRHVVYTV